jgi:hypothetical protein
MKQTRIFTTLFLVAMMAAAFQPAAKGSDWDKKTVVTINAPVEVPGFNQKLVLAPGTYVFKIMDSATDRNIVQIWNKDETHLITTILAIPDYRPQTPDTTIVKFGENVPGAPVPVKEWFYPGDNYGWEFVYPRERAVEIAKANNQNVLAATETSEQPRTLVKADVTAVTPQGGNAEIGTAANTKPH